MATVNNRKIVDEIIAGNGRYGGDPRVVKIVQYNNQWEGALAYGLIYEGEDLMRYHSSPACHNPQTIWWIGWVSDFQNGWENAGSRREER